MTCAQPTQNITLHSKDLEIKENEVTVNDSSGRKVAISKIAYDKENEFLIINLSEKLAADGKYNVFIAFEGKLSDNLAGFYRSSYMDKATNTKRWLATTQFEATDARRAFPCFDEPAMKATFEVSLGRMKNYTSISNMPIIKTEPM